MVRGYTGYTQQLWFALKLVSLNHWKQSSVPVSISNFVVICSQISIFEPLKTMFIYDDIPICSCDLLSN